MDLCGLYLARARPIHNHERTTAHIVAIPVPESSAPTKGGDVGPGGRRDRAKVLVAPVVVGHDLSVVSPDVSDRVRAPPDVLREATYSGQSMDR